MLAGASCEAGGWSGRGVQSLSSTLASWHEAQSADGVTPLRPVHSIDSATVIANVS